METIITLLLFLLPVIFKLIGKKYEKAGQSEKAEKMREFAKTFVGDDDDEEEDSPFKDWLEGRTGKSVVEYDDDGQIVEVVDAPKPSVQTYVSPVVPTPPAVTENVVRQTAPKPAHAVRKPAPRKPILEEESKEKKGEKIDPKKLVIYSEIMKPKFTE